MLLLTPDRQNLSYIIRRNVGLCGPGECPGVDRLRGEPHDPAGRSGEDPAGSEPAPCSAKGAERATPRRGGGPRDAAQVPGDSALLPSGRTGKVR